MTKKLTRSLTKRKIAGVCGGLGEYFNITPTVFRFLFLLLCLPGGFPGPTLYILFWIFMPAPKAPRQTIYFGPGGTFTYNQGGATNSTQSKSAGNLGDDYTETIDV